MTRSPSSRHAFITIALYNPLVASARVVCLAPVMRAASRVTRRAILFHTLIAAVLPHGVQASAIGDIDPSSDEPAITHRVQLTLQLPPPAARRETVTLALYGALLPATVANFCALVRARAYDDTAVYRVVPGLTVQMGDTLRNGGRSGRAATDDGTLQAEGFRVSHSAAGTLSMVVNDGVVDSRFFVTTREGDSRYLDGKYVAFGRVEHGMSALHQLEARVAKQSRFVRRPVDALVVSARIVDAPAS